jgi:hypothetical protein
MTKLLERAIEKANGLPSDMQDDLARIILHYVGEDRLLMKPTREEGADFAKADAEIARGAFASDEASVVHGFLRGSVVVPHDVDLTAPVGDEPFLAALGQLHG